LTTKYSDYSGDESIEMCYWLGSEWDGKDSDLPYPKKDGVYLKQVKDQPGLPDLASN
jgi:hypothetical protein